MLKSIKTELRWQPQSWLVGLRGKVCTACHVHVLSKQEASFYRAVIQHLSPMLNSLKSRQILTAFGEFPALQEELFKAWSCLFRLEGVLQLHRGSKMEYSFFPPPLLAWCRLEAFQGVTSSLNSDMPKLASHYKGHRTLCSSP